MTQIMGIVNVTPDSFSDGGKYNRPEEAVRRARNLAGEGASIIDFGAESTRPGATPLAWEEEWGRLEPVLEGFFAGSASGCPQRSARSPQEGRLQAEGARARVVSCSFPSRVPLSGRSGKK